MHRFLLSACVACLPTVALAETLSFSYNAGPIFDFDPFAPPEVFDFIPFEQIILDVTIDSGASFVATDVDEGYFFDAFGTLTARGLISGTTIDFADGVILEVSGANEFDIQSNVPADPFFLIPPPFFGGCSSCFEFDPLLPPPATLTQGAYYLLDDADYRTTVDFLSDPTSLTAIVSDITAHFPNGIGSTINLSETSSAIAVVVDTFSFEEPGSDIPLEEAALFTAFEFGTVASVPVPATLPMLLAGLGGIAYLARRKTARERHTRGV